MSESSIAAGIRRIEAITGENVQDAIYSIEDTLGKVRELLNNTPNVLVALQKSIAENASLRKQAEEYMHERVKNLAKQVITDAVELGNVKIAYLAGPCLAEVVKGVAFEIKASVKENIIFLAATHENQRPMLTVLIADNLVSDSLNASKIVREAAKLIQGGGGGQPHFAQAGGKNIDGLSAALDKMNELVRAGL